MHISYEVLLPSHGVFIKAVSTISNTASKTKLTKMKFTIIIILLISCFAASVQSMTVRNHDDIRNIQRKSDQQDGSSFKAALEKFSKCNKLRRKLMIKYRNRPRLLRRISKLQLECWIKFSSTIPLFAYSIQYIHQYIISLKNNFRNRIVTVEDLILAFRPVCQCCWWRRLEYKQRLLIFSLVG